MKSDALGEALVKRNEFFSQLWQRGCRRCCAKTGFIEREGKKTFVLHYECGATCKCIEKKDLKNNKLELHYYLEDGEVCGQGIKGKILQ